VAGALKDHKVATIVGVKSFGKGSVQELEHIQSGGVLKVTVARWFTPNGNSIDGEGIEPDETIKLTEDDIKNSNDAQLNWARDILLK
jgi:carboxyl-terminal processing protease